jgi:hypothetical protein
VPSASSIAAGAAERRVEVLVVLADELDDLLLHQDDLAGIEAGAGALVLVALAAGGIPRPFQPAIGSVVDRPWLSETSVTERLPPARVGSPEPPIAGIGKSDGSALRPSW